MGPYAMVQVSDLICFLIKSTLAKSGSAFAWSPSWLNSAPSSRLDTARPSGDAVCPLVAFHAVTSARHLVSRVLSIWGNPFHMYMSSTAGSTSVVTPLTM